MTLYEYEVFGTGTTIRIARIMVIGNTFGVAFISGKLPGPDTVADMIRKYGVHETARVGFSVVPQRERIVDHIKLSDVESLITTWRKKWHAVHMTHYTGAEFHARPIKTS